MAKQDVSRQYYGGVQHHAKPYRFKSLKTKGHAMALRRRSRRGRK